MAAAETETRDICLICIYVQSRFQLFLLNVSIQEQTLTL
jgi:hypothetical protein